MKSRPEYLIKLLNFFDDILYFFEKRIDELRLKIADKINELKYGRDD